MYSLDDPKLRQFCAAQAEGSALYHILYIQECLGTFSAEAQKVLHLRNETLLLVDSYMMPLYCRLPLKGYVVILSEDFCETNQTKAMLKVFFFHRSPEAITDMGGCNEEQKACVALMYEEYCAEPDALQPFILRNLARNLPLLASGTNSDSQLLAGHLLNYALQFLDLVDKYALHEKKKSFYTEKIGITEKMLTYVLQTTFQKTFREILTYRILIEAMRQLAFTNKSVTHIAHEMNYDASDFNKLFLKWMGVSPTKMRTSSQEIIHQVENAY